MTTKDDVANGFWYGVGLVFGLPAAIITSTAFRGFVVTKMWKWFMVPLVGLFGGQVGELKVGLGMGLSIFVTFLTTTITSPNNKNEKSFSEIVMNTTFLSISVSAVSLFTGWLVQFMI